MYPTKDHLDRAKLTLDILILLSILALLTVAVLWPAAAMTHFVSALEAANLEINRVTVGPLELTRIKQATEDTAASLQEARSALTTQYSEALELIACQAGEGCSETQRDRIAQLLGNEATTLPAPLAAAVRQIDDQVAQLETARATIADELRVIEPAAPESEQWFVVSGADRELDQTQVEARRLERAGYEPEILRVGTWYRTVVPFGTEEQARRELPAIGDAVGRQSYIQPSRSFCPDPEAQEGFLSCVGAE